LEEKYGKLYIVKITEKSVIRNNVVSKVDFNQKKSLDLNNDNINLTLNYPVNVKRGEKVYIDGRLKNNGKYESRGGITLSFPQLKYKISGNVISNTFSTDIKTYDTSDKIWSKDTGGLIYGKYLMVESNDEKWNKYEKHSFSLAIDTPKNMNHFKILVRAALRKRVVPGDGIKDQQGFVCKLITVSIID